MKVAVYFILTGILCSFFLWQAWSTIAKYQAAKTTLQVLFVSREAFKKKHFIIDICQNSFYKCQYKNGFLRLPLLLITFNISKNIFL